MMSVSGNDRVRSRAAGVMVVAMALWAAGCGGESPDGGVATSSDEGGAGAVTTLQGAEAAVVQIITDGTFVDPEMGEVFAAGSGSGFIVDADGLVVTNQHVVSGAGSVRVSFSDDSATVAARIVGVSECDDLAVLQLTDPGPYPYLKWFDGEIVAGTEIYAAGYPLGDPQYTVTRGVVSKTSADGNTSWSSVREVIEHDAATQPGSSGGPLLTPDGQVVGVHFASRDPGSGTNQFGAIPRDLSRSVSEALRNGDQETIGVNGLAVFLEDDPSRGGVWISGVTPGGPASDAGVLPGDVIVELNGVAMTPGTMEAYCDVLRSAVPGATMSVVLYRASVDSVLRGELNGRGIDAPEIASPDPAAVPAPEPAPAPSPAVVDPRGFVEVFDDSGYVSMLVPPWWGDVDPRTFDGDIVTGPSPSIYAAPDIDDYFIAEGSGLVLIASVVGFAEQWATTDNLLDFMIDSEPGLANCEAFGRSGLSNDEFASRFETFGCPGSTWGLFAIQPSAWPDGWALFEVRITDDEDLGLVDVFLDSLRFWGP
jgi:serine protease Do